MSSPRRRRALGSWREVGAATRDLLDSAISGKDGTPGKWKGKSPSIFRVHLAHHSQGRQDDNLSPTGWVSSMASQLGCIKRLVLLPTLGYLNLTHVHGAQCHRQTDTHIGLCAIHAIAVIASQRCTAAGPTGIHHAQDAI
jgi:hypothetical protein